MTTLLTKHSTLILTSLLLALFALAWLFPSAGSVLGTTVLTLSSLLVSFVILQKHRELYRQGRIRRSLFLRNTLLEIGGAGLAMICAGLLGRWLAGLVAPRIGDDLLRFAAGIAIGLLAGISMGTLLSRILGRIIELSSATMP